MAAGPDGRNALRNASPSQEQPGQPASPRTPLQWSSSQGHAKGTLIQGKQKQAREFVTDRKCVVLRLMKSTHFNHDEPPPALGFVELPKPGMGRLAMLGL